MRETDRPGRLHGESLGWEEWFEPVASHRIPFTRTYDAAAIVDYVSSFSVVAVLPEAERGDELRVSVGSKC